MNIRFISTKAHGVLDYIMGATLISVPYLLGLLGKKAESIVPISLGASAIAYSLITDYELGVARGISMKSHLAIDLASGLFLAASPFILGFKNKVFLPHVILGIAEVLASLCTKMQGKPSSGPGIKDYLPDMIVEKTDLRRVVLI